MRDIIYITTAQEEQEFDQFKKGWKFSLNPSNINFNNKMISCFSLTNKVHVFSIRPYSKSCENINTNSKNNTIGNTSYHYLKINKNKFLRPISYLLEIIKIIKTEQINNKPIIVCETINYSCLYIAKQISKKFSYPVIGLLTDSPNYISYISSSYKKKLFNKAKTLNGFIALNENLLSLYNVFNKPSIIINGLFDSRKIKKDKNINNNKPYFYYGGTCLKEFGIYNLIEAYKKLNTNKISLLISGHHENIEEINKSINGYDIKYLGNLSLKETNRYEENSVASINPRPYKKEIDLYSVSSKVIEYLSSKTIVISTYSSILHKIFKDEIIWTEDDSINSLYKALKKVIEMDEDNKNKLIEKSYIKAKELYSIDKVNQKLELFINKFF